MADETTTPSTPSTQEPVGGGIRVRVNAYVVMQEAVERGLSIGFHRANKHVRRLPDAESVDGQEARDVLEHEVMAAICEVFLFDGDER